LHNDPNIKGASVKAEEEFKKQYPAVYNYLEGHKEKLSKRNKAETGIRYEWYALQRWGSNYSEELIRPILRGKDIKRYSYEFAQLWVIYVPCGYTNNHKGNSDPETWFKKTHPSIYSYLINTEMELSKNRSKKSKGLYKRDDQGDYWWELRSCKYLDDFNKQKIIYPNMTKYLPFYLDNNNFYVNQKCFIITGRHLGYLTAFLNSKLFKYCFRDSFPQLQGGTRELSKIFFEKIKIKMISDSLNEIFESKVIKLQSSIAEAKDTTAIELEIDEMILDLYNLTEKEKNQIMSFSIL
jgi:adenine-specific DNA-methyltransferase